MTMVNVMADNMSSIQSQATTSMTMDSMDMADCPHQQTTKSCDKCSTKHSCQCVQSACSVSLGITSSNTTLSTYRKVKDMYKTIYISTLFQKPSPLFRPPIAS